MKIRLDRVREEPFSWEEVREIRGSDLQRVEVQSLGAVQWRGQVGPAARGFTLSARVAYMQTLTCMRCLQPTEQSVDARVELAILVDPTESLAEEHELTEEELGTIILSEAVLETDPILFEQLQLNVPMKPLCRSACRGLCVICGADLNAGDCGCERNDPDPRWAALASLKRNST